MGVFHPYAVGVRGFLQNPHLEHRFMLAHDGVAEIDRVPDDTSDHGMRPLEFICRVGKPLGVVLFATGVLPPGGAGHLLFPQSRSYLVRPHASVGILEYPLDYPCCFLVHDQLIVVIRGLAIPQGSIGAAVQSRLCLGPYGRTDFAGIVPAVKLVHDVF